MNSAVINPESPPVVVPIGKSGENIAQIIVIDCTKWHRRYGAGTITLQYRRPEEEQAYAVSTSTGEPTLTWRPTAYDLEKSGVAKAQVEFRAHNTIAKSPIFSLCIHKSLSRRA